MSFRAEVEELTREVPRDCLLKRARQINSALREAIAANALAFVVFRSGGDNIFNTMVLQSKLENEKKGEGYFLLDEFNPSNGHKRALAKERFILRTNVNGVEMIAFDNVILGAGKYKDGVVYKVALPSELYYLQRRGAFRVTLRMSLHAEVSFPPQEDEEDATSLNARIEDMSFSGMKVSIPGQLVELPPVGAILTGGKGSIAGKGDFGFNAEVRFSTYVDWKDTTVLGLKLVDVDQGNERMIVHIVNELQREERKESAGLG